MAYPEFLPTRDDNALKSSSSDSSTEVGSDDPVLQELAVSASARGTGDSVPELTGHRSQIAPPGWRIYKK